MNEGHQARPTQPRMHIWQYAWHIYRVVPGRYCVFLAIILGSWLLSLPLGVVPSQFFDTLTGAQPSALGIWGLLGLLAALESARALCNFGWSVVGVGIEYRVRALLQRNLLQRILDIPAARALPFSAGEAVNRFRDDVDAVDWLMTSWLSCVGACLFGLIGLILMARVSLPMTLLVFLPMVVILVVTNRLRPRIEAYRARSRQTTADTSGTIGELFHAVQAIKVARAEERMVDQFTQVSARRQHAALHDVRFNALLNALFGGTTELGISLIVLLAAAGMRAGTFTVGSFALFVFFLDYVPSVIGSIAATAPQYRQTGVAIGRLQELQHHAPPQRLVAPRRHVLDAAAIPAMKQLPPLRDPLRVLDVRNLTYTYAGSEQGIRNVSFRLERGQCVVITGRIGSGKTTVLRALLGLLPMDAGQILWNEQLIDTPATFFVPPHTAYTPQVPRLLSETLRDNILLGLEEQAVDLPAALHNAVLDGELPDLDILLGPRGIRLSGGQAQRTAAARMFVRQPELLVLDDVSSALDIHTEQRLWQRLFVPGHPAVLIVSHRLEVLRRANHILVLRDGRVVAEGTFEEVRAVSDEVRAIWDGGRAGDRAEGA